MKFRIVDGNSVICSTSDNEVEIHPLWLRERASEARFLHEHTKQRLYEPSNLILDLSIESAKLKDDVLIVEFSDQEKCQFDLSKLTDEIEKNGKDTNLSLWDAAWEGVPTATYESDGFEELLYGLLKDFWQYGAVVLESVPIEEVSILDIANSIGSVRPTNFGVYFVVEPMLNPNDLAYTDRQLAPHTDNPYRQPVPCVQLLLCIRNEVQGGETILVDGFNVAERIRRNKPELFASLTKTLVRFRFEDENTILENRGELIELDREGEIKQVRYSPRLDYVPLHDQREMSMFYQARQEFASLCGSSEYRQELRLRRGDLLMFDNYRVLHGRKEYNQTHGERILHGCYIDYDSTGGKLRHLERNRKA